MRGQAYAAARAAQQRIQERCRHPEGGHVPVTLPRPEDLLAHLDRQGAALASRVALRKGDERLTYGQLDERASRLARLILAQTGVGPEPIALLLNNGPTP